MQLGFVIDHAKCIGCHACTVACKSENGVPLGKFRTWVKYTEEGSFPAVKRSFAVLRCNQCTNAPCVTICPVKALDKRGDGIVDVDHRACIGCKSCMQACPYDALYINDASGTAEKCHFCAHRTELGLAPACAVVCPTEAIIPGDFHDPGSVVSRLKAGGQLVARKTEAGTGPNVYYREAAAAGLEPLQTNAAGGFLWANQQPGIQLDAQVYEAVEKKARARTVYDVSHPPLWGAMVSAYVFTKSLAAGAFLAAALCLPLVGGGLSGAALIGIPSLALACLLITTGLLVSDLKRPERFYFILTRPNWDSWLTRGTVVLMAYGGLLTLWLGFGMAGVKPPGALGWILTALTALAAALAAGYTGWLFAQAKGRVLWMRRGMVWHLIIQAVLAGCALLLMLHDGLQLGLANAGSLRLGLLVSLVLHLGLTLIEMALAPAKREVEYRRTVDLITHGPFARLHWMGGVALGIGLPLVLLAVPATPVLWIAAAAAALAGLIIEEHITVRAGQALPIS